MEKYLDSQHLFLFELTQNFITWKNPCSQDLGVSFPIILLFHQILLVAFWVETCHPKRSTPSLNSRVWPYLEIASLQM